MFYDSFKCGLFLVLVSPPPSIFTIFIQLIESTFLICMMQIIYTTVPPKTLCSIGKGLFLITYLFGFKLSRKMTTELAALSSRYEGHLWNHVRWKEVLSKLLQNFKHLSIPHTPAQGKRCLEFSWRPSETHFLIFTGRKDIAIFLTAADVASAQH